MNTKFTPEYVLKMLQEIKELSDQDNFYTSTLLKKYPSFSIFRQILSKKGILSKGRGKVKWISIIPNIIMAKEVSRLFLEKRNQNIENWLNNKIYESDNQIDNEIEVTENNIKSISILQENINPVSLKETESINDEFMSFAKKIRKEGEKWNDAVSRASKIKKGNYIDTPVKKGQGNHKMKATTDLAKEIRINNEKWTSAIKRASTLISNTKEINSIPDEFITIEKSSEYLEKINIENKKLNDELNEKKLKIQKLITFNNGYKELATDEIKKWKNEADRWKHEVENMNVVLHKETKIHEKESQDLINKLQISNKDLQFYKEKYEDLEQRNKKYIAEYSAFINEKLEVIEDLKKQLHQQQSEKNQVSVIKVLGIPLIKKTTKTIK